MRRAVVWMSGGNWRDRVVTGFNRTESGVAFGATLSNGPECGNGALDPFHPEWGPPTRDCMVSDQAIYFKRVR